MNKNKTMSTPYKMKGSPMKRNFGISPMRDTLKKSEQAKAAGASEATVQKLIDIEAGEEKKSELTDPRKKALVEAKLKELQPLKK